jgi:hypothetical protein
LIAETSSRFPSRVFASAIAAHRHHQLSAQTPLAIEVSSDDESKSRLMLGAINQAFPMFPFFPLQRLRESAIANVKPELSLQIFIIY